MKQRKEIGDHYVKQYCLKNYGYTPKTKKEIKKYRDEIIKKRKPKYFIDNKEFFNLRELANYISDNYNVGAWTVESRIRKGANIEECKINKKEYRKLKSGNNKGEIKVTDIVTKKEYFFCNSTDKELRNMFSTSAITLAIKTGNPTRITKLSKYKNPCIIERINAQI